LKRHALGEVPEPTRPSRASVASVVIVPWLHSRGIWRSSTTWIGIGTASSQDLSSAQLLAAMGIKQAQHVRTLHLPATGQFKGPV